MVFIDTLVGGFNLSVEYKRWSARSFFRNCWTKLTSKLLALDLLTDINCGNVDNLQKQLRRIYDSTLDRRPLSGKVFWRKILELKKKTDVKWLQMSQKRKSERREICLRIWGICGCGEIESLATCRFLSILAKSFGYCPCLYMFYIEFSEIPTCTF